MPLSPSAAWTAAGRGLGVALSGAGVVRALRPERWTADIAITATIPWLLAPSWALLAGAVIGRKRRLVGLALALAAFHAACIRPRSRPTLSDVPSPDGPELQVAFANVWARNPDVRGILEELAASDHDIVALAEVTDDHVAAIDAVLPAATYPWRWCSPEAWPGHKGFAIVSRVPLARVEKWWSQGHPQFDLEVLAPGALPFRLLVVHTWGPVGRRRIRRWRAQLAEIAARARSVATRPATDPSVVDFGGAPVEQAGGDLPPTVVMGDFNATWQHRSFERLLAEGWSDAGTLAYGGWRATWPAHRWWCPALFSIDHILAGPGISVRSGRAGRGRGSDHRPVSAVLVLAPAG